MTTIKESLDFLHSYCIFDNPNEIWILKGISRNKDNDENAGKDIEHRITVDGIEVPSNGTANDNTWYYLYLDPVLENFQWTTDLRNGAYYTDFRAQSIKVEVRQTSAVGTTPILDGRVQYATLETA